MLEQNKTLNQISYELIQDKLTMLFESVDAIGNSKYIEDLLNIKINDLRQKTISYQDEIVQLKTIIKEQTKDLDSLRADLREIVAQKEKQLGKAKLFDN
jgi:hypothetical protein